MKLKACKVCREKFTPSRPMQAVCSPACAIEKVKKDAGKKASEAGREESRKDKAKRESLKTYGDYIKEAQNAFNRYVRLRDIGRGCISCGTVLTSSGVGGGYDAGHYRSRGSSPHLRFHEDNCHGQCKQCNRYGSGNITDYRIGLLQRIGAERLDALEADQTVQKWTKDDLIAIKKIYQAKAKALEKG